MNAPLYASWRKTVEDCGTKLASDFNDVWVMIVGSFECKSDVTVRC
jgi:hypothetical protein